MKIFNSLFVLSILAIPSLTLADELPDPTRVRKSDYSLFNPVPRAQMRKMLTDRPNKTESPYTVDAGHFQFETDLVSVTSDTSNNGEKRTATAFNNINLKAGLTDKMDFEVIVESYIQQIKTSTKGVSERQEGFGDTTVRLKYNLFGNGGGSVGLGVLPMVKFPTSNGVGNKKIDAGLMTVALLAFPADTSVGIEFGFTRANNDDDDGHHNELVSSVTVSHELIGDLSGYAELFNQSSSEKDKEWMATFDTGLTYKVGKDIQWDVGVNLGITDAADDVNGFTGLTMRY